jgi:hypothetical protein
MFHPQARPARRGRFLDPGRPGSLTATQPSDGQPCSSEGLRTSDSAAYAPARPAFLQVSTAFSLLYSVARCSNPLSYRRRLMALTCGLPIEAREREHSAHDHLNSMLCGAVTALAPGDSLADNRDPTRRWWSVITTPLRSHRPCGICWPASLSPAP